LAGPIIPENGRKDLAMKHRRKFSVELKRQVVEELLSGMSTPAQLIRRHEIPQVFFTTGKNNTPGGALTMNRARRPLLKTASGSWNSWSAGSPWRTSF